MRLPEYLALVRREWRPALAVMLSVLALATAVAVFWPKVYTGNASMLFTVKNADSTSDLATATAYARQQVQYYPALASSPKLLESVREEVGLHASVSEMTKRLTVTVPADSAMLQIAFHDSDPARAAQVGNAVAERLSTTARSLSPKDTDGEPLSSLELVHPAVPDPTPTTPRAAQTVLLGAVIGVLLGFGAALSRRLLGKKVRSLGDVRAVTGVPVLGTIPNAEADDPPNAWMRSAATSDAYIELLNNLSFFEVDGVSGTIVIASAGSGGSANAAAAGLADVLADSGARVLMLDADLRRATPDEPQVAMSNGGLSSVLMGSRRLLDSVEPLWRTGVYSLPAGAAPPNPHGLLCSNAMSALLNEAAAQFDVVLATCPSLQEAPDAVTILESAVGGVAMVIVDQGQVTDRQVVSALDRFRDSDPDRLALVYRA